MTDLPIGSIVIGTRRREDYRKVPIDPAVRWAVWERDDFTCHYCGARRWLSVDHVVPESAGGDGTEENFVTACRPCNSAKGVRSYDVFTQVRPVPKDRVFWDYATYELNISELVSQRDRLSAQAYKLRDECLARFGNAPMVDSLDGRLS